jgi:hypothetical protein
MFEHFRPILQGELVSHTLVDLDLAGFEIKSGAISGTGLRLGFKQIKGIDLLP